MKKLILILIAISGCLISLKAQKTIITQWNFNSRPADANPATGDSTPNIGKGTFSLLGVTGTLGQITKAKTTLSSDPDTADNTGFRILNFAKAASNNKSYGIQFNCSTKGFKNIKFSFDLRGSNTSSKFSAIQYTTDSIVWKDYKGKGTDTADVYSAGNGGEVFVNGHKADFSSDTNVNNNSKFAIRIVSVFAPGTTDYTATTAGKAYKTTGTWNFDMITVQGDSLKTTTTSTTTIGKFKLINYKDSTSISVKKGDYTTLLQFKWNSAKNANSYAMLFNTSNSFSSPLFSQPSDNKGHDTTLTLRSNDADSLLNLLGVSQGKSTSIYWSILALDTVSGATNLASNGGRYLTLARLTSIVEIKNLPSNFGIYPNPASENVTITGLNTGAMYYISDVSGRIIRKGIVSSNNQSLDLLFVPKGIYFFTSTVNGQYINQKLIVQ